MDNGTSDVRLVLTTRLPGAGWRITNG